MAEDLNAFIKRNRSAWQEAERVLQLIESDGLSSLNETQVRRFGDLYRTLSSQLIYVRSQFSNPETEDYLNDLVARGYAIIYRSRRSRFRAVWDFYASGFPRLARSHLRFIIASIAILATGTAFGYVAGMLDPSSVHYIVPEPYASMDPGQYLEGKGSLHSAGESALMMGMITTNNIRVAIMTFAMGLTFGIGTVLSIFYNGVFLGSFCSIYFRAGKGYALCSLLAPHGLIEFSAILISGAAGFVLAGALLFPGERTRVLALREEGRVALKLFMGTIPIFLVAMFIESTLSKFQWVGPVEKYGLGLAALAALVAWIGLCGRQTAFRPAATAAAATP